MKDKILWFHSGVPTEQDKHDALSMGAVFRNPEYVDPIENVEECIGVMGEIPDVYREKFEVFEVPERNPEIPTEFDSYRIEDLRAYAKAQEIELPSAARTRNAILAIIMKHME